LIARVSSATRSTRGAASKKSSSDILTIRNYSQSQAVRQLAPRCLSQNYHTYDKCLIIIHI
jgi:hypothetical protein